MEWRREAEERRWFWWREEGRRVGLGGSWGFATCGGELKVCGGFGNSVEGGCLMFMMCLMKFLNEAIKV